MSYTVTNAPTPRITVVKSMRMSPLLYRIFDVIYETDERQLALISDAFAKWTDSAKIPR